MPLGRLAPALLRRASALSTALRTHSLGRLRAEQHCGERVKVCGWLQATRRVNASLAFLTVRDMYGTLQVKLTAPDLIRAAEDTALESVVQLEGTVDARPQDMQNEAMATGDIEVNAEAYTVQGPAHRHLPFLPAGHADVKEETRLRHRVLDLRRTALQQALRMRSQVARLVRERLEDEFGFLEVETPTLFRRTPGGAAEFLVPTQHRGACYALVQSPQQYKQMLMIGGVDRYYQIARCYRDEAGRKDRQPEFTQVDLEMSFAAQQDVMNVVETLTKDIWEKVKGFRPDAFPVLRYAEVMARYGTDKPDLRYDMPLVNVTDSFASAARGPLLAVGSEAECVLALCAKNAASLFSRRVVKDLCASADGIGAKGLVVSKVLRAADGSATLSVGDKLAAHQHASIVASTQAEPDDVVFLLKASAADAHDLMGKMRPRVAELLAQNGLLELDSNTFAFAWVTDFPLFEPGEEGGYQSTHHPFTAPHPDDVDHLKTSPLKVRGQHFDLVINGWEVGGGSIRIHHPEMQRSVLAVLDEPEEDFSAMLDALALGAPPHGGFAFGFDRLILVLAQSEGADSLRDVIAFPKSFAGRELMSGAPTQTSNAELAPYHLQWRDAVGEK